jgi:aspartate aminotransferase
VDGIERTLIRQIFDTAPPDAINLGLGQPDLGTPAVAGLAGIAGIARGETSYTTTAGDPELRAAVARRYAPFVSGPENVVITAGSQEALYAAMMVLADPDDEVLVPDPGYPAYATVARLLGERPVAYPLRPDRGFRVDPEEIASRLTDRTRLVVLCSPSNPTGAIHRAPDLEKIVTLLEARGVAWLSDQVYETFVYGEPLASPADTSRGGLVISGLSKELSMTGWRIGWVVGETEAISRVIACHQHLVTCAPTISQAAALGAFGPEGNAAREEIARIFRRRRSLMIEELSGIDGIRFDPPDGAFYFFVDVSRFGPSLDLARRILDRRKVITIPGVAFGRAGEGYLRLSFAATEEEIVRGVRAIGAEISES